jgi:hypothetical protein
MAKKRVPVGIKQARIGGRATIIAAVIGAVAVVAVALLSRHKPAESAPQIEGNNNTDVGSKAPSIHGDNNTYVGPTDNHGNTIYNGPVAIGYNAHAGPDSVSIGAHAGPQYDPSLIRKYDDQFEGMTKKRLQAALAVQEYMKKGDWNLVKANTDGLDDVLGFFETLGYDEQHGTISPEAVHEYFFDDIAAYYLTCRDYITISQKQDGSATFENIKPLFDDVVKIEAGKNHTTIAAVTRSTSDLADYFKTEANAVNLREK